MVKDPCYCKIESGRIGKETVCLFKEEFKLPGRAWLEFEVEPGDEGAIIRQTVEFDPKGVLGLVYWYGLLPIHGVMFEGMLNKIVQKAEEEYNQRVN